MSGNIRHTSGVFFSITFIFFCFGCLAASGQTSISTAPWEKAVQPTYLTTENDTVNKAFRIALGDIFGNIQPEKKGLLDRQSPVLNAGLDYNRPWTRDASINAWNGASLIWPQVSQNTLLSVLTNVDGKIRIGGQYWDAITWARGAWHHYLYTGDRAFLETAFEAIKNSLEYFEDTEFDPSDNLFRGPGWSDGVAAYPGKYGDSGGPGSILDWVKAHPDEVAEKGYGIPMKALSTNCLYYNGYKVVQQMARELNAPTKQEWKEKAAALKKAINQHFWIEGKEYYRFLIGPYGNYDFQEALGHSYALEFGVADSKRAVQVLNNQHIAAAGIPSVWPNVPRYNRNEMSFGRHSGTVWPQIQGIWATAAIGRGKYDVFVHEFSNLGRYAVRDNQFAEIYHPLTGEKYGGLQENNGEIILWDATNRQTWSATSYLRMLLFGIIGMNITVEGIKFSPFLPSNIKDLNIKAIRFRNMIVEIRIKGSGNEIEEFKINGEKSKRGFLPSDQEGNVSINIILKDSRARSAKDKQIDR